MYLSPRLLLPLGLCAALLVFAVSVSLERSLAQEPVQILIPNTPAASADIKIYVSGAVEAPAVYMLGADDRVEDAVRAAGGPSDDADLEAINLASKLRDGDHLVVPRQGQRLTIGAVGGPLLNINTATQKELEALPGIGEVRAKRIIDSRLEDGAFQDVVELLSRQIVTRSVFDQIKAVITAQ